MKVLLINGSPNENGCTFTALSEVAGVLEAEGVTTEIFHIGKGDIRGCTACGWCRENGRCVFGDDGVNAAIEKLTAADGLIVGSPVYFAGPGGAICSFMERLFFPKHISFALKPAAAVVSCRRGGASASFDRLNKYFTIAQMPVVSSSYWNSVHGNTPDEVLQDLEGLRTMRVLGRNMAWLVKSIAAAGLPRPATEPPARTNFIR